MTLHVTWMDGGRQAQQPSNPDYPDGIDLHLPVDGAPRCRTDLPYPAPRIGVYRVRCDVCGFSLVCTTAGRRDDPRSVELPCWAVGQA